MEIEKLQQIAYSSQSIHFIFGSLGFLLGQRSRIAKEILDNEEKNFKNPDEYKSLMYGAYDQIENQIKELLLL